MNTRRPRPKASLCLLTIALALVSCGSPAPVTPPPSITVTSSPAPSVTANGHTLNEGAAITSSQFTLTVPAVDAAKGTPSLMLNGQTVTSTSKTNSDRTVSLTQASTLPDGTYHVAYSVADKSGRAIVVSAAVTFTVDTQAPVLPPTSAAAPVVTVGGNPVPDKGSTAANTPSVVVPKDAAALGFPLLLVDGKVVASTLAARPDGNVGLTPQVPLANGPHQLSFAITDAAGNTSVPSASTSITVVSTPPTVEGIPTAAAGATTDPRPSITVPAIDASKGTPNLLVDGQVGASTSVANPDGSVALTPTVALSTGSHQLAYSVTNAAGSTSGASQAVTFTVQKLNVITGARAASTTIDSGDLIEVTGTSSSGHVTFSLAASSASVCSLVETTVRGRTPGSCVIIVASPAGTGTDGQPYAAAASQTITISVKAAPQTLSFTDRVTQLFRSQSLSLSAVSDRGLTGATYNSSPNSVCTVDSATGRLTGVSAGMCKVTATLPMSVVNGVTFASATRSKDVAVSGYRNDVFAGVGSAGYSGDGGPATSARFYGPTGVAVDASGNVYIADRFNSVIRKVTAGGTVSTFAGTGTRGYSGDGGAATSAQLDLPNAVAVDTSGNVFIADTSNHVVRKVDASGVITTFAGSGTNGYAGDGGPATNAWLGHPFSLAVVASGTVYIGDYDNGLIRKVDSGGTITTFAGTGTAGYSGDGGPATSAQLGSPYGLSVDASGNVYFTDYANSRLRRIDTGGIISTLAGTGTLGFSGDGGAATSAQIGTPNGVTVDAGGNVFFVDAFNSRVREIDANGIITTVVDVGPAAQLNQATGIAVDGNGNLYITDTGANQLRKLSR